MIKITCDSTADLDYLFKEKDIPFLPLVVNLGNESFEDSIDISPEDIYAHVEKTKQLPKTAARSEEDFFEFFSQFTNQGYHVVHFNISRAFSVSHENACKAAKRLPHVFVVDSKSLSTGTGLLVMRALDLIKEGKSAQDIYDDALSVRDRVQASFVVDSMEYLHKGGRCSGLVSFMASVLKIKPQILLVDGKMAVGKKYMGNYSKVIIKYVDDILSAHPNPDLARVFITFTKGTPQEIIDTVKNHLCASKPFAEIFTTFAGSTITSHCGRCTLGILYINN